MNEFTHVDLFSGIGGFALAAGWAGFRTVVFCEIEPFCQEVLKARFGAVADTGDTRLQRDEQRQTPKSGRVGSQESITELYQNPILIPDIRDFDGSRFRGTTLLTGGFPCQPFSCAGKRWGKEDDRHLWPEMLRVISEARPTWVVGENVAGIVNMELEQVCLDLEGEGYEVQPIIIPACAVNAPHRRDRVWIVANSRNGSGGTGRIQNPGENSGAMGQRASSIIDSTDSDAPDTEITELNRGRRTWSGRKGPTDNGWDTPWLEVALRTCVRGIHDGLPRRVDRLKALGNAIVPQVVYQIIKEIARIEEVKPCEE